MQFYCRVKWSQFSLSSRSFYTLKSLLLQWTKSLHRTFRHVVTISCAGQARPLKLQHLGAVYLGWPACRDLGWCRSPDFGKRASPPSDTNTTTALRENKAWAELASPVIQRWPSFQVTWGSYQHEQLIARRRKNLLDQWSFMSWSSAMESDTDRA